MLKALLCLALIVCLEARQGLPRRRDGAGTRLYQEMSVRDFPGKIAVVL